MHGILKRIAEKKDLLDSLRPLPVALEKNLYEWYKVALTYTSNAIEGNTLSMAETAQVIEKQITVGGKTILEHLEAINHAEAVDAIQHLSVTKKRQDLTVHDILALYVLILQKINDYDARTLAMQIMHSEEPNPKYTQALRLMEELITSLTTSHEAIATIAAQAHLQLVTIHPFVGGNGRTARLLMNLLLLQEQYPLIIINVADRQRYIGAIQKAVQGDTDNYYLCIYEAIERSLDEYIQAARESELTL